METLPLQRYKVHKLSAIINRTHTFIHSIAILFMLYYRLIINLTTIHTSFLPYWFLIFASELILSFLWLFNSAHIWRPISRSVFPENLPMDDELPAIDVFICTADPKKEPALGVVNTVLSAMAIDYPPEKVTVYLSDDGCSVTTLCAIREAWRFGQVWIPFCNEFGVKSICPESFFRTVDDHEINRGKEYLEERENIQKEYEEFKERLKKAQENGGTEDRHFGSNIEIISQTHCGAKNNGKAKIPSLVYVSREKNPSHPHHFKAGALNVLLRVSGIISNSPYILMLDCDMHSNDPSSARQAMCFHLDPKISPSLAFVQFPQRFHNISKNDIYDSALRAVFVVKWPGMDGLIGPMLSGTCFYMKRKAVYGNATHKAMDLSEMKKCFGSSNEFLNTLTSTKHKEFADNKIQEAKILASCTYEQDSQWGEQIGFMYHSVVEDYFTGFILHCKGWKSVFYNPTSPAFLGSATTNLNDTLVQGTRWNSGVIEVLFSRFCPLIYGLKSRMPLLECMCYAYLAAQPLYCFPAWILAIIPQLCLLNGIPIYPKVSSPWFIVYSFLFLSTLSKHLWDVIHTGGTMRTWWNEWRVWMMKSITAYFYGTLDAILKLIGFRKASFLPTNKVVDDERLKRYQMGIYDFQASKMVIVPLVTLVILNMISFIWGIGKVIFEGRFIDFFGQVLLSFFILMVNYPIIEGMILRKDEGSIPLFVTFSSILLSFSLLFIGSIFLM
ncbi:cellulose synthase-like protein G2 isoform X1 [Lycium ferocissimum]|uniref:cellulose synthase-like protein G2 isoform X1 n=1 Tax=Lycium ferocissimum TaxID=112874 RepID=UPI0028162DB6|nr:cellulose synthase-like protein G2 isoform X1 [Lycium ferocissimum]